ncbi:putative UDP-glucose 6-dehydrogenase [Indivirus ILV1]|uniref:Putative UDP-glucose 6-dehydrogenase n=1 Tax=Indivirus ILV1 TaxID=1977633 RepID=A0A1V0SE69_9VIRU|nr:putative UDP-glucose 6-dehydrogenase [Indivirus ILV1]
MIIGIIGIGFVGSAMMQSFIKRGYELNRSLFVYDKYKEEYKTNNGINTLLHTDIIFIALPTLFDENTKSYNLTELEETLNKLEKMSYSGAIVIKSTLEPTTCDTLSITHKLNIIHNPEFLTARTAFDDFHNQKHIVLGKTKKCDVDVFMNVYNFYKKNYVDAQISICNTTESESMKIFLNSFYGVKVQFFTELYLLCDKLNISYTTVRELMLKNGWINPMHTIIPGPDGNISYGGMCFPKDTNALLNFMIKNDSPHDVIDSTIKERNTMRKD